MISKGGSRLGMCAGSVGVVVWLMLLLLCAETQGRSVGVSSLRLPTGRCSFDGGTCVMFCAAMGLPTSVSGAVAVCVAFTKLWVAVAASCASHGIC